MAGVDYKPFDFRLFVEVEGEKLDDAEAAKKAADDVAAEELRAAETEAAALPAAERAARFLELARRAEEEAAAEVAGDDPSAVDKKAAEDAAMEQQKEAEEEVADLPSEETKEAEAVELKAKGDAPDAPLLAAVDKFAVLRKANEEDARLKAEALSEGLSEHLLNGGKEIKSNFVRDAGLSAQYALNSYAVAQAFYENTGEWEKEDDKLLPFLHIQIEMIYAR